MSETVKKIIKAKEGNGKSPTVGEVIQALDKQGGLTFTHPEYEDDRYNARLAHEKHIHKSDNVENDFRQLVMLVGLKRGGEVDVDGDISAVVNRLAWNIVLDGQKLDEKLASTVAFMDREGFRDASNNEAEAREVKADIINRVESAYNELFGPAKTEGRSV